MARQPTWRQPTWTVLYNIRNENTLWIGTGREFFDNKNAAKKRYEELSSSLAFTPTLRRYHEEVDRKYLGAIHRL